MASHPYGRKTTLLFPLELFYSMTKIIESNLNKCVMAEQAHGLVMLNSLKSSGFSKYICSKIDKYLYVILAKFCG